MFPGSQYGTGSRIQDRATELDMSGFLQDIGAEDLPSFDSDFGDSHPRRSPTPPPVRASAMRKTGFLDESFHDFLDDMGVDELPSFESEQGAKQAAVSPRVPHPTRGPTMRRTELDMDGFLDEMGVDELPSFGSDTSGERLRSPAYGVGVQRPQQTRVSQTPTSSRRIPMSAFLESPTGDEIEFASTNALALPPTPEHLKRNLHISGLSGMTDLFEELEDRGMVPSSSQIETEQLLRETEEYLASLQATQPQQKQISPRSRALAEMFPTMYPPTRSPTSPRRPPSQPRPTRSPASPGIYPSRAPTTRSPASPGMPRAASSPKKRIAGPSPRMSPGATPFPRSPSSHPSPRQPVRPVYRLYEPQPDDLIQFQPSVYTDYYDFIGRPELMDADLMTFAENYDWTASTLQTENEIKLREYEEIKRILQRVLRAIQPHVHYSNVEPPLVLLKALVAQVQDLLNKNNMLQNLRAEQGRVRQQGRGYTSPPRASLQRQPRRPRSLSEKSRSPRSVRFR